MVIDKRSKNIANPNTKINIIFIILTIVVVFYGLRLFYVQIIQYAHYKQSALNDQLSVYQIPANRGLIYSEDANGSFVPIVLNQKLYTLYANPSFIKNPSKVAQQISKIITNQSSTYFYNLIKNKHLQYVILATKLSAEQNKQLNDLNNVALGTKGYYYRVYPDGDLASQVLGFVNNNGQGEYGVEQALNKQLAGKPGLLKAITDVYGVPLAASKQNTQISPTPGKNVVLTLNIGMQQQLQNILSKEYVTTKSQGVSAIIMNPYNGHVKAMANYPTYNPRDYQAVTNPRLFLNNSVDYAIEPGSIMKTLTTSAALDSGAVQPNSSFFDPAHWVIDNFDIHDIKIDGGPREQNIQSILSLSLNTGATWMLMQMSHKGGTQILPQGIETWHDYMVNHYHLGQSVGIQQGYEDLGYVPPANINDPSIDLRYANTAFGQGVSVTPIQIVSALSAVINGGTYYRPTLVAGYMNSNNNFQAVQPTIVQKNIVNPNVGKELVPLMEGVVKSYFHGGSTFMNFPSNYIVGGKTGTAQVAKPTGGYYANIYNGTYIGFVGGNKPQYMIVVFNIKPTVVGYAGTNAAQPIFADIAHMLINEGYVTPKYY